MLTLIGSQTNSFFAKKKEKEIDELELCAVFGLVTLAFCSQRSQQNAATDSVGFSYSNNINSLDRDGRK